MRIALRNIVLVCLLLLSVASFAISFEVQVPLSEQKAVGSVMTQRQPLATGRFQTTVNPLDANGYSYSPSQVSASYRSQMRKERDDPSNPSDPPGMDTPLGDTPFVLMLILALTYIAFAIRRRRNTAA